MLCVSVVCVELLCYWGTLRCTRATGKAGGKEEGSRGGGRYVVMCCDVRIDAGTKCWSSEKGDYHVGHVTGETVRCRGVNYYNSNS